MVIDNALPHELAVDCIAACWLGDLAAKRRVHVPAERFIEDGRYSRISFQRLTCLAVDIWCRSVGWRRQITDQVLPSRKRLVGLIKSKLNSGFKYISNRKPQFATLRFPDIANLGQVIAQNQGYAPFIITAYSGRTRPTDFPDGELGLEDISKEAFSYQSIKRHGLSLRTRNLSVRRGTREECSGHHEDADWLTGAKALLRSMCSDLEEEIHEHVNTDRKRAAAKRIIGEYRIKALAESASDSVLVMAIDYAEHMFVEKASINARSLRSYLDRTVICGFLNNEESLHMADWESEDLLECLEERLSEPRLSKRSRQLVMKAFKPFLKFLNERYGLPGVSLAGMEADFIGGAGQWMLLSPKAIDLLILRLNESSDRRLQQAAVTLALGFYGGLRIGDVSSLRLSDVVFSDRLPVLDVEVRRGKSRNARRRLPLHSLAPPQIQDLIRGYCLSRLSEFPERKNRTKISLFGPAGGAEAYQSGSLADLSRAVLKDAFGEDANFHTLRHCFCSFLFLRWYALANPGVLKDLRDASHPTYQPDLQEKLNQVFSLTPHEDGDVRPYDLITMIKLTGHANPEPMFLFYVHTLSIVQAHEVANRSSILEGVPVTGAAVAELLPKMRSPKSRAANPCRTLGEAALHLLR